MILKKLLLYIDTITTHLTTVEPASKALLLCQEIKRHIGLKEWGGLKSRFRALFFIKLYLKKSLTFDCLRKEAIE